MNLQCNQCGKSFPTNASLYQHKQLEHPIPKLVLHNHSHENVGSKRRPSTPLDGKTTKKRISVNNKPENSQEDDNLRIIDEYENKDKRKMSETDAGLEIIDEYDNKDLGDPQLDDGNQIIDGYDADDQSDSGLTVIDSTNDLDYKKLYKKCLQSKKSLKTALTHKLYAAKKDCNEKIKKLEQECNDKLRKQTQNYKDKLKGYGDDMEKKYSDRLSQLKLSYDDKIKNLVDEHKKEMDEYEKQCQDKIKKLKGHIQAMKDDDDDMSALTKAIFNCTTIEEIFQIQRLIQNYQFEKLVRDHLPTLQNLLLSLSYGILPICQPQRDRVTDNQRKIVENLQTASRNNAKNILRNNQYDVVNLFTIIKDSIKLARDAYNRYGGSSS